MVGSIQQEIRPPGVPCKSNSAMPAGSPHSATATVRPSRLRIRCSRCSGVACCGAANPHDPRAPLGHQSILPSPWSNSDNVDRGRKLPLQCRGRQINLAVDLILGLLLPVPEELVRGHGERRQRRLPTKERAPRFGAVDWTEPVVALQPVVLGTIASSSTSALKFSPEWCTSRVIARSAKSLSATPPRKPIGSS